MKELKDFKGYIIYPNGRILSLPKKTRKKAKYLNPVLYTNGYYVVDLVKNGDRFKKTIHRLVAETFIPNPKNKPQVNHKNGIKTDNRVENLEWVTISENRQHAFNNGLQTAKGSKNSQSKLNELDVMRIRVMVENGCTNKQISETYNISQSTVCDIKFRRSWSHLD